MQLEGQFQFGNGNDRRHLGNDAQISDPANL